MYSDVYCSPESHGLVLVAEIEYSDGDYQFDLRAVWKHTKSGVLYTGTDSGCSCPSPFEDYHSLDQLDVLDYEQLRREVRTQSRHTTAAERADFLRKVRLAAKD